MQTLQVGSTLQGGKYRILDATLYVEGCKDEYLGQGGFGITYLAEHCLLGTKVAIKEFFMKDFCDRDETSLYVTVGTVGGREQVSRFKEKFLKEARSIAKLHHHNIVRISDVFEENGTAYYVMDYCEGGSLSGLIKLYPSGIGEPLALKYIRQIASALEHVHAHKMNHLDIKPANILLDSEGNAVLIDFGLSKQYDVTGSQTSTTPVGISHGYAPIEQYKQGGVSEFSPSTDIYSLGATLYKLITGQTPPYAQLLLEEDLPTFIATDSVANAIRQAMQVRRANRPQSVTEWVKLLDVNTASRPNNTSSQQPYVTGGASSEDDEATRVAPTSAMQEEEDARQRDFQEKMKRAQEEAALKAAEEARKQSEIDARRKAEEEARKKEELRKYEEERKQKEKARRREEEKRRAEEEASKQSSKFIKTSGYVIAALMVVIFVINIIDSSSTNNSTSANSDVAVTHEAMYYEDGKLAYYWTGMMRNGFPDGYGTVDFLNDDPYKRSVYKGYMKNGLFDGNDGTLTYRDGSSYVGGFSNGNFVYGTLTLKNRGEYFKGTYRDDNPYNGSWYHLSDNKEFIKVVNGEVSQVTNQTNQSNSNHPSNNVKPSNSNKKTSTEVKNTELVEVKFSCNSAKAKISIDGREYVPMNETFLLYYGTHTIRIDAPGYKLCERTIDVVSKNHNFYYTLEKY